MMGAELMILGLEVVSRLVKVTRDGQMHRERYGFSRKLVLTADKAEILADGVDLCTAQVRWEYFDVEKRQYVPQANHEPIQVDVAGQVAELVPDEFGEVRLTFSSAEAGEHLIRTVTELVENSELKVVAVDA